MRKITKYFSLTVIFLLTIIFIGLLSLTIFENNKDLQAFALHQAFGKDLKISGDMNVKLGLDDFNIKFKNYSVININNDTTLINVKNGEIAFPPMAWLFGNRDFRIIYLNDAYFDVSQNIKPFNVKQASKKDGIMQAEGTIGKTPFKIHKESNDLSLSVADISLKAIIKGRFTNLDEVDFRLSNDQIKGTFDFDDDIKLTLTPSKDKDLDIKYKTKDEQVTIKIKSEKLSYEDIEKLRRIGNKLTQIYSNIKKPNTAQSITSETLYDVEINNFYKNNVLIGKLDFDIRDIGEEFSIDPRNTIITGAKLEGNANLAKLKDQTSTINFKLRGFDYVDLLQAFGQKAEQISKGKANFSIDIKAQGVNANAWKKSASGNLRFKAYDAEFDGKLINLWGGGLVNFLIPSFDKNPMTKLNCAVLNSDIDKGIAQISPFLMDTKRVTVIGKGQYNISENTLNVVLKPKSKGIALGDLSSDIQIKGPIDKPNIGLDKASALKKLGMTALGTLNPAFFIFSFADLGLNEDNPCESY